MKDKKYKEEYKDIADMDGSESEQEERRVLKRASIAVILIVLFLVVALSCIVYVVELNFGKTAGTVTLVILALIIAAYLYKDEIKNKFKRKQGGK